MPSCLPLASSCVYIRGKPWCNTQTHHQMAPLRKPCFATWLPCTHVYSKHGLVKCLWKREENLLWEKERHQRQDSPGPLLGFGIQSQALIIVFYFVAVSFWRQKNRCRVYASISFVHVHLLYASADALCDLEAAQNLGEEPVLLLDCKLAHSFFCCACSLPNFR